MKFTLDVQNELNYYVYRLIDPRDGSTFYIGKGKGNRIFDHINSAIKLEDDEDEETAKYKVIREISAAGLEVIHIIHRHNLTEEEAFAVEAALIDITPGLTNEISGRASDYGPANVIQLMSRYNKEAFTADPNHNLILINVNNTYEERGLYDAVRYAWVINVERAKKADYILAISRGVCLDVFVAEKWMHVKELNVPNLSMKKINRYGFIGCLAPDQIRNIYKDKRLPECMMPKKGSRAPVRYFYPET